MAARRGTMRAVNPYVASDQAPDAAIKLVSGAVGPTTRGALSGATLGLDKYLQAGIIWLMERGVPFEEALAAVRDQEQADMAHHPGARLGGEVLGSLIPTGAAAAKAAGSVPKLVAANTAMGAVSGATQNAAADETTLRDAGLGAALGGVGAAIVPGLKGGAKMLKRSAVEKDVKGRVLYEIAEKAPETVERAKIILRAEGTKPTPRELKSLMNSEEFIKAETKALADEFEQRGLTDIYRGPLLPRLFSSAKGAAEGVVPAAIAGMGVGATGASFMGKDPLQGAMYGGAGAVGLRKAQFASEAMDALGQNLSHRAGRVAKLPEWVNGLTVMGANAGVPQLTRNPEPASPIPLQGAMFPWEAGAHPDFGTDAEVASPVPAQPVPGQSPRVAKPQFPWDEGAHQ